MRGFIVSTIAYLPAYVLLIRFLDNWGLDEGRPRTLFAMLLASVVAYGAAYVVELIFP